jgi:hypothetical protein
VSLLLLALVANRRSGGHHNEVQIASACADLSVISFRQ